MRFFRKAAGAVRQGLARTRSVLGSGLRSLLAGRRLDDDLIDQIEANLIGADVGVKATNEIVGELREAVRKGELEKGEDAIDFLKSRLKRRWDDAPVDIAVADPSPTVVLVVGVRVAQPAAPEASEAGRLLLFLPPPSTPSLLLL